MTSSFYLLHALSTSPYPFFFFNDTATTEIYTLSLHDALPILAGRRLQRPRVPQEPDAQRVQTDRRPAQAATRPDPEPRERGEGSDGLRAVHAGGGDPGAQSGGAGERERPGGRQAHQPGRGRPVLGAAAAVGGGGA